MDIESLSRLFLSEWIVDHFDIVNGTVDEINGRIDLWLDEKKKSPTDYYAEHEVIAYGFTIERTVQDFPVRGKGVYLHIRRRKWQIVKSGKVFSQPLDISYKGTRLTNELVAFLKATN